MERSEQNNVIHLITFDEMFGRPTSGDILSDAYEFGHWGFSQKTKFFLNVLKAFRFVHNKCLCVPAYWLMNNPYLMMILEKKGKHFVQQFLKFIVPKIRSEDKSTFAEMKEDYILGSEKQSSYWSEIRKFDPSTTNWGAVQRKLIAYMDFLHDTYGQLPSIKKESNFSALLYDQILNKFERIDNFKLYYSFLQEKSVRDKVKSGIEHLKRQNEHFGMSSIVHHIDLAKNHEDNIFRLDCDESLRQEIISFCRGSYLWVYRFFLGLDFYSPNSHHRWKKQWEEDINIELLNYVSDADTITDRFYDIESALIRFPILEPLNFSEIEEIKNDWPDNEDFKTISHLILSQGDVDRTRQNLWNKVIDNLMEKLRWKAEERSRLHAILSQVFSTLFKKNNREKVKLQAVKSVSEFVPTGTASDHLPFWYSMIKSFCKFAYGVSEIEKEERRETFKETMRRDLNAKDF